MKTKIKTSLTLSREVVRGIDRVAGKKRSRSAVVDEVLRGYLSLRERAAANAREALAPVARIKNRSGHIRACGRPPVQSVGRPLPNLVAYGSTNKYRPVNSCKMSGTSARRPTQVVYLFCATATMLTMTPTVKA